MLHTNAGLTEGDWDDYEDVMLNESDEKIKAHYHCWMQNYLTGCSPCPPCPDDDPFD